MSSRSFGGFSGHPHSDVIIISVPFDIYTWARDPASYNSYGGMFDKLQAYAPEDCKLKSPVGININAFRTNYYGYIEIK